LYFSQFPRDPAHVNRNGVSNSHLKNIIGLVTRQIKRD